MTDNTNRLILTASDVYTKLIGGLPVERSEVQEKISLNLVASKRPVATGKYKGLSETVIDTPVVFRDCRLNELFAEDIAFYSTVILEKCLIQHATFLSCYAKSGITITDCEFLDDMDLFRYGGHNAINKPIRIINCVFHGFVNIEDAWFTGPVTVSGCRFVKGTNLLANRGQPFGVNFELVPVITANEGVLDRDS